MADLKALFGKKPQPVETTDEKVEAPTQSAAAKSVGAQGSAAGTAPLAGLKLGGFGKARPAQVAVPVVEIASAADTDELNLDSLADSIEEGIAPRSQGRSGFADEISASAPVRELPDDLTKQQLAFVELMDNIYGIVHEPDLVGQVIRSIMVELKSSPQYMKLVAPSDIRTWIKAMRDTMGLVQIQKAEKKAKTAGRKTSSRVDSDMLADLADLGLSLD